MRAGRRVGGEPFVCVRAEGPYAYDAAGRRYVDYVMAYGPLLFGHTPPFLHELDALAARGVVYGSTTPDEIALAERIRAHLPSMEKLRFTTTGSEAVQSAVRVARAFTGRDAMLKFSGNYHGHFDLALQDAGASAETPHAERSGHPARGRRAISRSRATTISPTSTGSSNASAAGSRRSWSSRCAATWGSCTPCRVFWKACASARTQRRAADLRRDHHVAAARARRRAGASRA